MAWVQGTGTAVAVCERGHGSRHVVSTPPTNSEVRPGLRYVIDQSSIHESAFLDPPSPWTNPVVPSPVPRVHRLEKVVLGVGTLKWNGHQGVMISTADHH